MQRVQQLCSQIAAIIVGSALIALSATADEEDPMILEDEDPMQICSEWIINHLDEPEWERACLAALQRWESRQVAELPVVEDPLRPPSGPFPIEETAILSGPHDGDRESILQTLRSGQSADILVEFEVSEVRDEIHAKAQEEGLRYLDVGQLTEKRAAYASIKSRGLAGVIGVVPLRDYDNLPSTFVRVLSEAALNSLIARSEVKAVHENRRTERVLSQSLSLIHQPAAAAAGRNGAGTTVAVLDTGVDYTISPFNCSSPGVPASCRVAATYEAAPNDFTLDDGSRHGTNVSAITASTAGATKLAVADVFDGGTAPYSDIEAGINWAIANQSTLKIVAMNLSLGNPNIRYSDGPCGSDGLATPLAEALAAGIRPIIAAGNGAIYFGAYFDGISPPACAPAAVRVGAVYDANIGGATWNATPFQCTDTTTSSDKVACFSQSAFYLSLLAPGALITAGGVTYGGTSQAAPHVAGAWAIMRAVSNLSEGLLLTTLQDIGDPITDPRPSGGRTTSRLDLLPEPGQFFQLGAGILALWGLGLVRSSVPRTNSSR